jgi:hypothetical protein
MKPRSTADAPGFTGSWMACVPADTAPHAALLRLEPRLEIAEGLENGAPVMWLRGSSADALLLTSLRRIGGLVLWEKTAAGLLRRPGDRLPSRAAPEHLAWKPVAAALPVAPPPAAFAASVQGAASLRLVRSDAGSPASMFLTTIKEFASWAETAPEVRLDRLSFAAAQDGRVFVRGDPLPPLSGEPWAVTEGVGVPCGWSWQPAVSPAIVRRAAGAGEGDLVLISPGGLRVLARELFIPARRSSIRATFNASAAS